MTVKYVTLLACAAVLWPSTMLAQSHGHGPQDAPYAGLETRAIKSLSEQDLAELRRGGGWGLALPAELNGWPGPVHLLELQQELALSAQQVAAFTAIYEEMRGEAIAAGTRFITAEAALSDAFGRSDLTEAVLSTLLAESAEARAALRFIHLSRHLQTAPLLSADQIQRYNQLRGYTQDPCAAVPDGHNPDMWRRHNGCD